LPALGLLIYDSRRSQSGVTVINKSLFSNAIAIGVVIGGLVAPAPYQPYLLNTGLFALSGGITNWLAIHMLFERVPGLYGSGVIQLRFEEFKLGIRELIMEQFFDKADLSAFLGDVSTSSNKLQTEVHQMIDELDLDEAFESLLDVIMSSSFSGMLGMIGGREALASLKQPFIEKMKAYFNAHFASEDLAERLRTVVTNVMEDSEIRSKLEALIDERLNQMTPQMVKVIVQTMIRKHLGWLVVWGCAFGGLIGLIVTVVNGG
jgi:uncharacterized membrane protein YheB (UPF0754 family)